MTPTNHLSLAGFAATAIAFGPARMGFGLFLPDFRESFALSSTLAGLIASAGFLAFLFALPMAALLVSRFSPRAPVVAGALLAAAGFATVAAAGNAASLAAGICLAGTSAGLCWAPFNYATERVAPPESQSGVLSVVATGTSVGVGAAAALSLAVTYGMVSWPGAWLAFAFAACLTAFGAFTAVPGPGRTEGVGGQSFEPQDFICRAAMPLYGATLCFGATNATYISFAADRVVAAGGLAGLPDMAAAPVIFLCYGLCGLTGVWTGRIEAAIGLGLLLRIIFAAAALSMVLVALAPTSWTGVLISSGLHGAALMSVSAIFSFWSFRLFPGRGTFGFTAALLGLAAGSVIGPAIAGYLADGVGPRAMFMLAGVPAVAVACWPRVLQPN